MTKQPRSIFRWMLEEFEDVFDLVLAPDGSSLHHVQPNVKHAAVGFLVMVVLLFGVVLSL